MDGRKKPWSKHRRLELSIALTGRKLSEEHKQKLRKPNIKLRRRFCKYGHDTNLVGRVKGGCRLCSYIQNSEPRGVKFYITEIQFSEIVSKKCIYDCSECNETGIDRIDNTKGYVKGNCQPMCRHHNFMKNRLPIEKFKALCASVK